MKEIGKNSPDKLLNEIKDPASSLGELAKTSKVDRTEYLLEQDKPEFKSLGIGIHTDPNTKEEFFYFGTKVYDGNKGMDAVITSENKVYIAYPDNNQIKYLGINYRYPFFDSILDYAWSNNTTEFSIKEYIYGKEKIVTLKECYEDTLQNELYFMDFSEDMTYVSKSCGLLSSFYLPIFETKARDFDNADRNSGKTKDAMLWDLQMFNPLMSADITGASFFRAVESTSCSIIIDDFDAVPEEKRIPLIQILRTGYKKGQKVVRTSEGKTRLPEAFNIFNSMKINNVGGLDEITEDRCNKYMLIKSTDKQKINRKINDKDPKWQIQRDKKYFCALQNWKQVKDTYESLEIEGISGRDWERLAPILTIGKIVLDDSEFLELVEYEKRKIEEHKDKDVSTDWLFLALKEVIKNLSNSSESEKQKGIWIRLDELVNQLMADNYTGDRDYDKTQRHMATFLGKCFRQTPLFISGKVHGGFVRYLFEPTKLIKFLEIKDYLNYFDKEQLDKISIPIRPIQPIQSNLSIQSIQSIPINKEIVKSGETGYTGETGKPRYTNEVKTCGSSFIDGSWYLEEKDNQINKLSMSC